MAPVALKRLLDVSLWPDASQPKLSRRYYSTSINYVIPLAVAVCLILLVCCVRVRQLERANASVTTRALLNSRDSGVPWTTQRPQAVSVPPPISDEVIDPPPPYIPLQTLEPTHKPTNLANLERLADTERNVGDYEQGRGMQDA